MRLCEGLVLPPGFLIPLGLGGTLWWHSSGDIAKPQTQINGLSWTECKSEGIRGSRGERDL